MQSPPPSAARPLGLSRSRRTKSWIAISLLLGLGVIDLAVTRWRERPPEPVEPPRPATVPGLLSDYQRNEVAADRTWKGHTVELPAMIVDVRKDVLDRPYVMLGTKRGDFNGVQCLLAAGQEGRAASFDKGDHATFRGRVGGMTLGSVMLENCVWVN